MAPQWFAFSEIPYDLMWPDDIYWLPHVLAGKKIQGEFCFSAQQQMTEFHGEILDEQSTLS